MRWVVLTAFVVQCACTLPTPRTEMVYWSALPNGYATHFEAQLRGEERRLIVFGPGGRVDTAGIYVLRGAAAEGAVTIPRSLDKVAVLSTTHLPYFSALGAIGAVRGIAHTDRIKDPHFRQAVKSGSALEVARADGLDRERLVALAPQLVFDYPFGQAEHRPAGSFSTVQVSEYLEEHPLGRAEWIRFFGMILGQEQRADSLFAAIEHRYLFIRGLGEHLPPSPTVLFGSHWDGSWFAPSGNSYMATLIKDSGGRYLFADTTTEGNIALPLERLLILGDTVDHLGVLLAYRGAVTASALVGNDPRIASLKCVRSGGFFGNSETSDLFGQALLEPDVVLRDLRCIFHPSTCSGHVSRYFSSLGQ